MKTLKTFFSTLLIVAFLCSMVGCEKTSNSEKSGHGHSHD